MSQVTIQTAGMTVVQLAPGCALAVTISGGAPGPRGADGLSSDSNGEALASVDLIVGQPVTISRSNGQMLLADSSIKYLAYVPGVVATDCASGFIASIATGKIYRADWTPIIGSTHLQVGQPYFLGRGGTLSTTLPSSPDCVTLVGYAISQTSLDVSPQPPIQL